MQNILQHSTYNANRIIGDFRSGKDGMHQVLQKVENKEANLSNIRQLIFDAISPRDLVNPQQHALLSGMLSALVLLFGNSGTAVTLNPENRIYNVGYVIPNVRSGRTFAAAQNMALCSVVPVSNTCDDYEFEDPSDNRFLSELNKLNPNNTSFYLSILGTLLRCDTSCFKVSDVNTLMVDFWAIYTAESIRFAMTNFVREPYSSGATLVRLYKQLGVCYA